MPAIGEHVTAKHYIENAFSNSVDESSLLKLDPNEEIKLHEHEIKYLKSNLLSPKTIIEITNNAYIDSLSENGRNRRDMFRVFNDQDYEFHKNKSTKLDSVTVHRNPSSENGLRTKNYNADELNQDTILRFNHTFQIYLKVSVGTVVCNLTKYDRRQTTVKSNNKLLESGGYPQQQRNIKYKDKNNAGKIQKFLNSSKTISSTGNTGAMSSTPMGDAFMYIGSSGNNFGSSVLVSVERTGTIEITKITFITIDF